MDCYGCPLCCHQKFNSIVALREHLLYFTFRPLLCVLCRMTIGGIYELTRHLETHLTREKNSSEDVVKNFSYVNSDNYYIKGSICNFTNPDARIADNNWKTPPIHYESQNKTSLESESFVKSKNELGFNSTSDIHLTELAPFAKKDSTDITSGAVVQYIDHEYVSISTTNSELILSGSTSENLSICSSAESEPYADDQDSTVNGNDDNFIAHVEGDALRAFTCHECGAKIVGKDFYFNHLQEHTDNAVNTAPLYNQVSNASLNASPADNLGEVIVLNEGDRLVHKNSPQKISEKYFSNTERSNNYNNNERSENMIYSKEMPMTFIGPDISEQYVEYSKCAEIATNTGKRCIDISKLDTDHRVCTDLSSYETQIMSSTVKVDDTHLSFQKGKSLTDSNLLKREESLFELNSAKRGTLTELNSLKREESFVETNSARAGESFVQTGEIIMEQSIAAKSCSTSMQHYVHKKFDHDHERKFEGLSSDNGLQCYIQNFQSLLVNKLNQAFENDGVKSIPASVPINETDKERDDSDAPHIEIEKGDDDKYKCRFCTKSFVWKQTRDTHELNRKCFTSNKCKNCSKEFAQNNTLCRHEQEIHADEVFYCDICGRHFKSLRYLANHKGIHDSSKNHSCSQCPAMFHTASGLRSHISESHSETQRGRELACQHCGEIFKRKYGLQRHIERKHSSNNFLCRYCNKEFPCKEDLNSHLVIHLQSTSLSCNICDMVFTSPSSLKRHKEKHSNVAKSFKCKTCSAIFTRKDSLLSHVQSQHDKKPKFVCKCGKTFNKASHLKYHSVKHSKEPPQFSCEDCGKTFKFRMSLRKHTCKGQCGS